MRLDGFARFTEDIDVLLPWSLSNGERVIPALSFLAASRELDPSWFAPPIGEPENIRVADDLLIDLLFAANGQTCESLQGHSRVPNIDGVEIHA